MGSDLLNIGSSGLNAYRGALATVSENVTNANSEGYTRRKIVLTESPVSSGTSILYRPQVTFGGVNVGAVTRSWAIIFRTQCRACDFLVAPNHGPHQIVPFF